MPYTLVRTLVQPLSYAQRLCLWQLVLLVGGLLVWAERRRPAGAQRLALALALFPLNAALPMMFDRVEEVFTIISIFIAVSVTNTKAREDPASGLMPPPPVHKGAPRPWDTVRPLNLAAPPFCSWPHG